MNKKTLTFITSGLVIVLIVAAVWIFLSSQKSKIKQNIIPAQKSEVKINILPSSVNYKK